MLIICEYTLKSNEIVCKVTIFFEYTQVYSKKYSFFCTYTFFFVPLQSQTCAEGCLHIIGEGSRHMKGVY